eukprot:scaffold93737_cov78-Cyclotella_meneghiniana.AAC.1
MSFWNRGISLIADQLFPADVTNLRSSVKYPRRFVTPFSTLQPSQSRRYDARSTTASHYAKKTSKLIHTSNIKDRHIDTSKATTTRPAH